MPERPPARARLHAVSGDEAAEDIAARRAIAEPPVPGDGQEPASAAAPEDSRWASLWRGLWPKLAALGLELAI